MRNMISLILLAALVALSGGLALAQDTGNATIAQNETNGSAVEAVAAAVEEVAAVEAPVEAGASRFTQLSVYDGSSSVLGKGEAQEMMDVSQSASPSAVFTRDAGELSPSAKLGITSLGLGDDKYVTVTSKAVGEWDLTGWTLSSADSTTYTFPAFTLNEGAVVRVHEGEGQDGEADLYTNSAAPLWIDNIVSLADAEGDIISSYDVSTQPAASAWVDPLAKQIQY